MEQEKVVTLDLTGCRSLGEIHQRIKKAFDFPDFYGENWDAFWDLIQTECDADKVAVSYTHLDVYKRQPLQRRGRNLPHEPLQ